MTQQNDASCEVVEQRHRDAAADWYGAHAPLTASYEDMCQRFARFERTHLAQPSHAGASREEIARIVDPSAWRDEGYSWATWRIEQSLKKADEIIAALSLSRPTDQMGEGDDVDPVLQEIADGAWGDGPATRGLARDAIQRAADPPAPEQVGGEMGRRFIDRIVGAALSELPKTNWSCSDDASGTALTLARQRNWSATEVRKALKASSQHAVGGDLVAETIERCAIAARDALCAMEWPPQDGDRQIDEVMAAIHALPIESAKSAEDRG